MKKIPVIHALIPARSGSKGIPNKNIKTYKIYPLIGHSIIAAKNTPSITRIIVSTNCPKIQRIARQYGAEAPFLRPDSISGDLSPDIDCFKQYIAWLKFVKEEVPDIIVHLRPTYPERTLGIIQKCITKFLEVRDEFTSLRTVIPIDKSLFKMYLIEPGQKLIPTYKEYQEMKEPYNQVRQLLPITYQHNGCVDIISRGAIEEGSMTGDNIYGYVMSLRHSFDLDTMDDWKRSLEENQGLSLFKADSEDESEKESSSFSETPLSQKSGPIDIPV